MDFRPTWETGHRVGPGLPTGWGLGVLRPLTAVCPQEEHCPCLGCNVPGALGLGSLSCSEFGYLGLVAAEETDTHRPTSVSVAGRGESVSGSAPGLMSPQVAAAGWARRH